MVKTIITNMVLPLRIRMSYNLIDNRFVKILTKGDDQKMTIEVSKR